MWIWYRCQNRIEKYYHHVGEQLTFYQKVLHIKTHRLRKEECFCNLCIAINSNLLDENRTQDSIQNDRSWLKWIAIGRICESVFCKFGGWHLVRILSKWTPLNGYFLFFPKMLEKHLWKSLLLYLLVKFCNLCMKQAVFQRCSEKLLKIHR